MKLSGLNIRSSLVLRELLCAVKQRQTLELTFIESITFLGRNLFRPTSLSKYSKLDFLSKATCGMSLKKRL